MPSHTRSATSITPAAIYQRHVDAMVREQPGCRPDPSRLDGEVAARMAVAGHSRDWIANVIKAGASASRPGERRDWNLYAQRATDFAFSPPGREMQVGLAGQRQMLVRLEGKQDGDDLSRGLVTALRQR